MSTQFISVLRKAILLKKDTVHPFSPPGLPQEGWIHLPFSHASPEVTRWINPKISVEHLASEGPEGLAAPPWQGQHWTTEHMMLPPESAAAVLSGCVTSIRKELGGYQSLLLSCSGSLKLLARPQSLRNSGGSILVAGRTQTLMPRGRGQRGQLPPQWSHPPAG